MTSPFLQVPVNDWIDYNEHAFAIWDGYPVNPGHVLVVPFRDARDWFEALPHEQAAIMDLVGRVKMIPLSEIHRVSTPETEQPRMMAAHRAKAWTPIAKKRAARRA